MNMETEKSSRKKLLVPLVVLLLCAVSLTGAAYAYNSTLNVNNNSADAGYLSIDLAGGTEQNVAAGVTLTGNNVITYTDNYDYSKVNTNWVKKNTVNYAITEADVATYDIAISRETGNTAPVKLTVTLDGLSAADKVYIGGVGKAVTDVFKITLKIGANSYAFEKVSGVFTATVDSLSLGTYNDVALHFAKADAITDAEGTAIPETTVGGNGYKDAKALQEAFNGVTFAILFSAGPTA